MIHSSNSRSQTCIKVHMDGRKYMLNKQAENKCSNNNSHHKCRLERAKSTSSFLHLSSPSFYHRWRREINPNPPDTRLINIILSGRTLVISLSLWLDLTVTKWRRGQRKLFCDDSIIPVSMSLLAMMAIINVGCKHKTDQHYSKIIPPLTVYCVQEDERTSLTPVHAESICIE